MLCSCSVLDTARPQTQQVLGTPPGSGALASSITKQWLGGSWLLAIHFPTSMSHPISTAGCPEVFLITSYLYITKKQTWPLQFNILVNITVDLNSSPLSYRSLEHCFSQSWFVKKGCYIRFKLRMFSIYRQASKAFICIHHNWLFYLQFIL